MLLPRKLTLAVGAIALTAPVLTSCGFQPGTNRPNTITAGTNAGDGDVRVLGAVIVSAAPGAGTLVVTVTNDSQSDEASLESISAQSDAETELTLTSIEGGEIAPQSLLNLAELETPVGITGDFVAGQVLPLTFTFDDDTVDIEVPVVTACDEYEGFDTANGGTAGDDGQVADEEETAASEESASAESTESTEGAGTTEAYDCEFPEAVVEYGPEHGSEESSEESEEAPAPSESEEG